MDEEFAHWLKNKHEGFHDILIREGKHVSPYPIAPPYHVMDFPARTDVSFDPIEFSAIYNLFLIRDNIIEDFRLAKVKDFELT